MFVPLTRQLHEGSFQMKSEIEFTKSVNAIVETDIIIFLVFNFKNL